MRHRHEIQFDVRCELGPWRGRLVAAALGVAAVGVLAAGAQALRVEQGWRRFMLAYLTAFAFVLSLGLGGLFFVFLQHLTRAGWSVLVRRFAEALAASLPVVAVLFVPIAVSVLRGQGELYPWARPLTARVAPHDAGPPVEPLVEEGPRAQGPGPRERGAGATGESSGPEHQQLDDLTLLKRPYLNPIAFVARWAVFLAFWAGVGVWFWRSSVRQDQTGDPRHTWRMEHAAGPVAVLFALTLTLGAFDLLMSLDPHWSSTIFGVYYFAGCVVGSLAVMILLILGLQWAGALTRAIGTEHQHDLGKLLFAFVFFWGYIAFSQYMLLWYGSIPEEIAWLRARGLSTAAGDRNAWTYVALALLVGHLFLPFAALLSRHVKRRPGALAFWAAWLLGMHYLDLAWLVQPELGPRLALGPIEIGLALALGGVFFAAVVHRLGRASLVPVRDPRLEESVAFENV